MRFSALLLIVTLGAMLAGALYLAFEVWAAYTDVEISNAGMLFMVLGIVVSMTVGGGLMALAFYSRRKGFDDDAA